MDFIDSLAWWQLILLAAVIYLAVVTILGSMVARAKRRTEGQRQSAPASGA